MKYVLTWLSGGDGYFPVVKNYYVEHRYDEAEGAHVRSSAKVSKAKIFSSYDEAEVLKLDLNDKIFMGAVHIEAHTDKQMFVIRLENK